MLSQRLRRLPERAGVRVATGPRARLLGLAFLHPPTPGTSLLFPRTRSVHTFGMRFALDLHWLDAQGRVIRVDRAVPPRRVRTCAQARAVIEVVSTSPR
ncbi:MAG: DUF192 domain-containing protein [Solirubrobacteraceae bacterium]